MKRFAHTMIIKGQQQKEWWSKHHSKSLIFMVELD